MPFAILLALVNRTGRELVGNVAIETFSSKADSMNQSIWIIKNQHRHARSMGLMSRLSLLSGIISLGAALACSRPLSHMSDGISIADTLLRPSQVVDIVGDEIHLQNQRTIVIPGVGECWSQSKGFKAILLRGLDAETASPRVYCLVSIYHRCGNDPISEQLERVDLIDLVEELSSAVKEDKISSCEEAFHGNDLWLNMLTRLIRRYNINWDERSNIQFP